MPGLLRLLDREHLVEVADRREFLGAGGWRVRAWLLAERGPSPELERLLFEEQPAYTHQTPMIQGIWAHANSRAGTDGAT